MNSDIKGTESMAIIGTPPLDRPMRYAASPATIQNCVASAMAGFPRLCVARGYGGRPAGARGLTGKRMAGGDSRRGAPWVS